MKCGPSLSLLGVISTEMINGGDHFAMDTDNSPRSTSLPPPPPSLPRSSNGRSIAEDLMDKIEDFLRRLTFNKQLTDSYDSIYQNQTLLLQELRTTLLEESSQSGSSVTPPEDYFHLFEMSQSSIDDDEVRISNFDEGDGSTAVPADVMGGYGLIPQDKTRHRHDHWNTSPKIRQSSGELLQYLVQREKEILRLETTLKGSDCNSSVSPAPSLGKGDPCHVITRYWELWEKHQRLCDKLAEVEANESSLTDALKEQEQLTLFYAFLNHTIQSNPDTSVED